MTLGRLLHPYDESQFWEENWERAPLLVERDDPDYYCDLFSLRDLDGHLQNSGGFGATHIHVVVDGKKNSPSSLNVAGSNQAAGGVESVYQAYRRGATLIIGSLQHRWKPVRVLAAAISRELSAGVNINAYLTPSHAAGFGLHYDTHDVFILQTTGAKHWRVFPPTLALPFSSEPSPAAEAARIVRSEPVLDVDLTQGSTLFIPRGFWHQAQTLDSTSLHLTLGVHVPSVSEVVRSAITRTAQSIPEFRASLPPGFATDPRARGTALALLEEAVVEIMKRVSVPDAWQETAADLELFQVPDLEGHLLDLDAVKSLTETTPIMRRRTCNPIVHSDGAKIKLAFHGKEVRLPDYTRPVVDFICESSGVFRVVDLPQVLDTASMLLLVRTFCSEGLVTLASHH
jgi:Cupin superfamily protein